MYKKVEANVHSKSKLSNDKIMLGALMSSESMSSSRFIMSYIAKKTHKFIQFVHVIVFLRRVKK